MNGQATRLCREPFADGFRRSPSNPRIPDGPHLGPEQTWIDLIVESLDLPTPDPAALREAAVTPKRYSP